MILDGKTGFLDCVRFASRLDASSADTPTPKLSFHRFNYLLIEPVLLVERKMHTLPSIL